MVDRLYQLARRLLSLARDTHENKAGLKKLEQRVDKLSDAVRELTFELRRMRESEAHEREKMALRLENILLRFERDLSSAPPVLAPGQAAPPKLET